MLIPPFLTPTLFGMPFRTNFLTYMVQCVALLGCGTALLPPFEIVMCFLVAEATAYFLERNHKISFYLVDLRGRKERSTRVKLLLAQLAHSRVQRDVELRNVRLPPSSPVGALRDPRPARCRSNTCPFSATRCAIRRTASSATRSCCRTRRCRRSSGT